MVNGVLFVVLAVKECIHSSLTGTGLSVNPSFADYASLLAKHAFYVAVGQLWCALSLCLLWRSGLADVSRSVQFVIFASLPLWAFLLGSTVAIALGAVLNEMFFMSMMGSGFLCFGVVLWWVWRRLELPVCAAAARRPPTSH